MKKKSLIIVIALVALLCVSLLGGCGRTADPESKEVTEETESQEAEKPEETAEAESQEGEAEAEAESQEGEAEAEAESQEGEAEADAESQEAGEAEEPAEEGSEAEAESQEAGEAEETAEGSATMKIAALKGPTAMGMIKMMKDSESADGSAWDFTLAASPDEVAPLIIQGQVDIAAVPANLAATIFNKTNGEVEVIGINTLGVLYIVEKGESVNSVEDLKGKTIYASGQGATPEYALNYILKENGLYPETDVTIEWKSEHAECLAALNSADEGIAMLPQPFVTVAMGQAEGLRVALDLTEEWTKAQEGKETKSSLITGVTIARKEFVESNEAAVKDFLAAYKESVDFVNANPAEAGAMIGEYEIVPAPVAEKAIPHCKIVLIQGNEMKEALSGYLEVLYEQNPQSVGGEIPTEGFYYK